MVKVFNSPPHLLEKDTGDLFLSSHGYWYFAPHTLHTFFFFSAFFFSETHTIKSRRSLPRAHIFLRWSLAFKRTGTKFLLYPVSVVPSEETSHFCVCCHSTFVYLTFVLVLSPKCSSTIFMVLVWAIFMVLVWNPERWTVCEIRNFLFFLEP